MPLSRATPKVSGAMGKSFSKALIYINNLIKQYITKFTDPCELQWFIDEDLGWWVEKSFVYLPISACEDRSSMWFWIHWLQISMNGYSIISWISGSKLMPVPSFTPVQMSLFHPKVTKREPRLWQSDSVNFISGKNTKNMIPNSKPNWQGEKLEWLRWHTHPGVLWK